MRSRKQTRSCLRSMVTIATKEGCDLVEIRLWKVSHESNREVEKLIFSGPEV